MVKLRSVSKRVKGMLHSLYASVRTKKPFPWQRNWTRVETEWQQPQSG